MITLQGSCRMCGGLTAAVEVEIPHATAEHRKKMGASRGVLCTAVCRECTRSIVGAWAEHGKAEWARKKAARVAERAALAASEDER